MHSKVIIASLICMLAANFGNKGIANLVKAQPAKANQISFNAPNDRHAKVTILDDRGAITAGGWFEILVDVPPKSPSYTTIDQRNDPYDLLEGYFSQDGKLGITINIPSENGDYFIGFEIEEKEVARVFIFVKDGKASVSPTSKYGARSKFFMDNVATASQKNIIYGQPPYVITDPIFHPNLAKTYQSAFQDSQASNLKLGVEKGVSDLISDKGGFYDFIGIDEPIFARIACQSDVQRTYNQFVYGDANDITTNFFASEREILDPHLAASLPWIDVTVNAYWVDANNVVKPLKNQDINLYIAGERATPLMYAILNGEEADTSTKEYAIRRPGNARLSDINVEIRANSKATNVKDVNDLTYAYVYTPSNTARIANYESLEFNVYVYANKGDRSNAFEMSQAQMVPYQYVEAMGESIPKIVTNYPSDETYYDVVNNQINIRREQGNNWDVLNHEYGHYIIERFNFSKYHEWYGNDHRLHDIKQNLVKAYGINVGKALAYNEGLATYFALASQMYSGIDDVPGVGDYYYQDPANDVSVNFEIPSSGVSENQVSNQAYEATVTSILIKMMDDNYKNHDVIALGHETMWSLFGSDSSIDTFINTVKNASGIPYYVQNYQLDQLLKSEYEDETFLDFSITTNPEADASWTININPDSAALFSSAGYFELVFVGEDEDVYTIPYLWFTENSHSYTLTREQIINVLALSGVNVYVTLRGISSGKVVFESETNVRMLKGNAYDLLCHWSAYVDRTNRRYRWVSIEATNNSDYKVTIDGRWSGQAVQLFDRIILDDETVAPLRTINGTSSGITFTEHINRGERIFMRIDNNCFLDQYSYRIGCMPVNN